jgi:mannosyltransferase
MTGPEAYRTGLRATDATPAGLVMATAAAAKAAPAMSQRAGLSGSWPLWLRLLPSAVTACLLSVGIAGPSYWRDEAATVAALRRPLGALIRMLGHVDAVHGLYYLLIWPVGLAFGYGETALRLPSVLAASAAAGVVAATGRRLVAPRAGMAAGLLLAVVPAVCLYGQMARSYAFVILAAAVASLALVRALDPGASRRSWLWYAGSLTLLGALNIFALLLIPAHGITTLATLRRRHRAAFRSRPRSRGGWSNPARGWVLASGCAVALTSPLFVLGYRQRAQLGWIEPVSFGSVRDAAELMGPPWMTAALLLVIALGLMVQRRPRPADSGVADDRQPPRPGTAGLHEDAQVGIADLCLPWLVVPPVALLLASVLITPVYTVRYTVFCVPAGALLAGSGVTALARCWRPRFGGLVAASVMVIVAVLGLDQQVEYRQPGGHSDNIAEADQMIAASFRPGDAVYYPQAEAMTAGAAYPYGLSWLRTVQLAQPAIPTGTLAGTQVPVSMLRQRLAESSRFWMVQLDELKPPLGVLDGLHVRLSWTWQVGNLRMQLYVRSRTVYEPAIISAPVTPRRPATS